MNEKILKNLYLEELREIVITLGFEKYRAEQIFRSFYGRESLKGLSKAQKEILNENFLFPSTKIEKVFHSEIDKTKKALIRLHDDNIIEAVFMDYNYGNTVCLSTQVGCKMGCVFCQSGKMGLKRQLEPFEMLDQFLLLEEFGVISNIVLMGMGEPLDNYDNVIRFIRLISDEKGRNLGLRNITLSTVGEVKGIRRLADENIPIGLALSLHSADQERRERIIPSAKKFFLKDIKEALLYYQEKNNRRITLEYTLITGENDSKEDAEDIKKFARGLKCHINLIPINPIKEYNKVGVESLYIFKNYLDSLGLNATIRKSQGGDIKASCGQLSRYEGEK